MLPTGRTSVTRPAPGAPWLVGLLGAAGVVPIELLRLGTTASDVIITATVLLLALGLSVGLLIQLGETLIDGAGLHGWSAAVVRGAETLPATGAVASTLFEGAYAATLPGASWGWLWVPAVGWALAVATFYFGAAACRHTRPRLACGAGLAVSALGCEWVNRTVERSEYPDVHTFLVVVALVSAGLALYLALPRRTMQRLGHRWMAWALGAMLMPAIAWVLLWGLGRPEARWTIARQGMHTRLLVHQLRHLTDVDGDGHAAVLGGGDCDELDSTINPGARDIPANGIDEDCDGRDATEERPEAPGVHAHARRFQHWLETPPVQRAIEHTAEMNVVLVVVDALRADVLRDTPTNRRAFPNLFALLDESRTFTRAFAPSAGTDLSLSGLLTGRIDPFHDVELTLAEAYRDRGYGTYAVIPREVLRYVGRTLITRGLARYQRLVNDKFERDVGHYTTSARTTELGMALLDDHRQRTPEAPAFLWLHYFDVHEHHEIVPHSKHLRELQSQFDLEDRHQKYRALASLVDEQIGVLMTELQDRDLRDRTIIVLASDHGESLGEDPRLPDNHGRVLYNPLVHVPLAIHVPGVPPKAIATPVSLLDVYPTLLQLAGATVPSEADGMSLLGGLLQVSGAPPLPPRAVPLHESDQVGLVMWPHKLLVRPKDNLVELYDLARDFEERNDLAPDQPRRVQRLHRVYKTLPPVELDRTRRGRQARERAAKDALARYR